VGQPVFRCSRAFLGPADPQVSRVAVAGAAQRQREELVVLLERDDVDTRKRSLLPAIISSPCLIMIA
jgi:hypothetical protein